MPISALERLPDHHAGLNGPAQLASAFELFNELSLQLTDTYRAMEVRVTQLNDELHQVAEQRLCELQEKERFAARLQSLLTLLPAGVILLDQQGRITECNPAAVDLLGEPLTGQLWRDVIARCFAPRSDDGHEISLRDGRRISIATRSLDAEPGQLLLLTDMTETRALQQRLSRHQRLSEMGRMVSSLAHQIRTPLSAALLYAGHLSERELQPQQIQRFSRKIFERLLHLEQQVKDMLIFVRGDVKLTDTITTTELLEALQAAMEAPVAAAQARSRIANDCPQAQLHCSRDSIVGALMNLVNNAIQAGGKGVALDIRCERAMSGGQEWIRIAIADDGPGFGGEVAQHLNEPFFTTKAQGTGLGLSVVRAIAQAHHGDFTIAAEPGRGACALMQLPVWPDDKTSSFNERHHPDTYREQSERSCA